MPDPDFYDSYIAGKERSAKIAQADLAAPVRTTKPMGRGGKAALIAGGVTLAAGAGALLFGGDDEEDPSFDIGGGGPVTKAVDAAYKKMIQVGWTEESARGALYATGDPDAMAETVLEMPVQSLMAMALNDPMTSASQYRTAAFTHGFIPGRGLPPAVTKDGGVDVFGLQRPGVEESKDPFTTSETGAIKYKNGVIANPETGEVLYPPNNKKAEGSAAWLHQAQETWSKEKVTSWRKQLSQMGYDVGEKGMWDVRLMAALTSYHQNKYLNYGKAIPNDLSATGAAKEQLKDAISGPEIRQGIREMYVQGFGDMPTDQELDFWEQGFRQLAKTKLRKGHTAARAAGIAGARMQEKFMNDPQVKYLQEVEDENTSLHDSIVRLGQAMTTEGLS